MSDAGHRSDPPLATLRDEVIELLRDKAVLHLDEPVLLASGERSDCFVDVKSAVADGRDLSIVCGAIIACARVCGFHFDAVGGPTLGAVPIAAAIAASQQCRWFAVRSEPKPRGLRQQIEGAALAAGDRVLLIEDVVTSGGSVIAAAKTVRSTGARVVGAAAVVDRGGNAAVQLGARAIPYVSLADHTDLGLSPVSG